jgi:hypothetical protein
MIQGLRGRELNDNILALILLRRFHWGMKSQYKVSLRD